MKTNKKNERQKCPKCESKHNQIKVGFTKAGSQRCVCKECNYKYVLNPKQHAYPEEIRKIAMREYYSGVSGRGVGKIHNMNKANVYNWIKKTEGVWISPKTDFSVFELDELYWFIKRKEHTKTRENAYLMTMISRIPRQIVGFNVDNSVTSINIQKIADSVSPAEKYYTDGCPSYLDVIFGGKHIRNIHDKSDTHNIESTNSDLRHHIPGLARRSRCFFRTLETVQAVLSVFVDAYNKFGEAKLSYRIPVKHKSPYPSKHLHEFREPPFSVLDFL
jgi:IS1 family transposase/transposase-like protein